MYRGRTIPLLIIVLLITSTFAITFTLSLKRSHIIRYSVSPDYLATSEVRLLSSVPYWRFIRINDVNVSATGQPFSLQTKASRGITYEYDGFWGAIAVKFSYYYPNYNKPYNADELDTSEKKIYNVGVDDKFYDELQRENLTLIFLSDYNGTHFTQDIIFVHGTVLYETTFYDYENEQDRSRINGTELIYPEVNHTRIVANTTESIYNPSTAIYNSAKYFKDYYSNNHTLNYILKYTFLVPTKYLPAELRNGNLYNFTWIVCYHYYNESARYSDFTNETGNPITQGYEIDTLYFMYVALNGSILSVKSIPIISVFAGGDNSPAIPTIILVIFGGLIITIVLGLIFLIKRKPRQKKRNL